MRFRSPYGASGGLTRKLHDACAERWDAYCWHPFVQGLAEGTLPLPAFQRYLVQDWLFLVQFARAKALAAFKAESLEALRGKASGLNALDRKSTRLNSSHSGESRMPSPA